MDPFTDPWDDVIYGPITYDVSQVEGDPVSLLSDKIAKIAEVSFRDWAIIIINAKPVYTGPCTVPNRSNDVAGNHEDRWIPNLPLCQCGG